MPAPNMRYEQLGDDIWSERSLAQQSAVAHFVSFSVLFRLRHFSQGRKSQPQRASILPVEFRLKRYTSILGRSNEHL
ncbi:hypothetical protein M422DRAFT_32570 [Sphaerobolus stellatus SS14]|uniref:Uncharacterized protein n=1 Tax=Sphaerobolus stellatus (strain SS14) TaxID=990650 RepID=A0A0C9VP91_SPHS4|nr:hypothetical protein M422DRAFT_32570 [Sphaerobolus stellatus SS14]